jgi:hypothetical protein
MKIADVRTSLSMMRAHANGGDEARFDEKSHQNA